MKKFEPFGVSLGDYKTVEEASFQTYLDFNGNCSPTPIFTSVNPFKEEIKNAKQILEIGCGVGRNLPPLMAHTSAKYFGLDPNKKMLDFFWEFGENIKWRDRITVSCSLDDIPNNIDFVLCTFVFQHIAYMVPVDVMNVTDITKEIKQKTIKKCPWLLIEHQSENIAWVKRWKRECDMEIISSISTSWHEYKILNARGEYDVMFCQEK